MDYKVLAMLSEEEELDLEKIAEKYEHDDSIRLVLRKDLMGTGKQQQFGIKATIARMVVRDALRTICVRYGPITTLKELGPIHRIPAVVEQVSILDEGIRTAAVREIEDAIINGGSQKILRMIGMHPIEAGLSSEEQERRDEIDDELYLELKRRYAEE